MRSVPNQHSEEFGQLLIYSGNPELANQTTCYPHVNWLDDFSSRPTVIGSEVSSRMAGPGFQWAIPRRDYCYY